MAHGPGPETIGGSRGPGPFRDGWIWLPLAMVAVAIAVVYPRLPERMVIHWNAAGQPDGWAPRWVAAWSGWVLAAGIGLLLAWLPNLDPRRENYPRFAGAYRIICRTLVLFLLGVHTLVVLCGLGVPVAVDRLIPVGIGTMFVLLGNVLGQVRPNYFVGIRTPWTLASEEVWRRTHRVGARLFVLGGLLAMAGALPGGPWAIAAVILGGLGAGVGSAVYSYFVWRHTRGGRAG